MESLDSANRLVAFGFCILKGLHVAQSNKNVPMCEWKKRKRESERREFWGLFPLLTLCVLGFEVEMSGIFSLD